MKSYQAVKNNHWFGELEDAFHPFFHENLPIGHQNLFSSLADNFNFQETDDYFLLTVDVPGIDPKNIQIKVQENILSLAAKEGGKKENGSGLKNHTRRSLSQSFCLPAAAELERIEANCQNGILEVILPKKKSVKPRAIEVQSQPSFMEKIKKQFKITPAG